MSHCPIFGTLGRLLYVALTTLPIWVIAGRPSLPALPTWLLGLVVGLMVSDTIHWVLDVVKPSRKGSRR